jgi:anti-sigma B factor antagonist
MVDSKPDQVDWRLSLSSAGRQRTSGTRAARPEEFAPLQISQEALSDGLLLFGIRGELEATHADRLEDAVLGAMDGDARKVVVDLEHCSFIDSTGLGVLLRIARRLRAGDGNPGLAVVEGQLQVRRIFEITNVNGTLSVFPTRGEAIASLRPPRAA